MELLTGKRRKGSCRTALETRCRKKVQLLEHNFTDPPPINQLGFISAFAHCNDPISRSNHASGSRNYWHSLIYPFRLWKRRMMVYLVQIPLSYVHQTCYLLTLQSLEYDRNLKRSQLVAVNQVQHCFQLLCRFVESRLYDYGDVSLCYWFCSRVLHCSSI
jgi:hypothetical protein